MHGYYMAEILMEINVNTILTVVTIILNGLILERFRRLEKMDDDMSNRIDKVAHNLDIITGEHAVMMMKGHK